MKKKILLLISAGLFAACSTEEAESTGEPLRISAASSLTEVLEVLKAEFQDEHPDIELTIGYGSSSKLRTQIEQGAPADLFLSASEADVSILTEAGLIDKETVVPFAANRLVVASADHADYPGDIQGILTAAEGKIAVGEPESVPLGQYTKQVLSELGLWEELADQAVYAKDARQVLTYTESGNAELGIVYASDAFSSEQVEVLAELPEGTEPIIYPAGILSDAENTASAQVFLEFLTSTDSQDILRDFGFQTPESDPS